jgi:hypothetical protein
LLGLLECRDNKLADIAVSKNLLLSNISLTGNEISNQKANNMFVALLQNVRSNPRQGSVAIDILPTGAGEGAMNELKGTYQWTIE